MEEPISARYLWDPDAMAEALAAHQRHSLRPAFRFLLFLLTLLYMAASIGIPLLLIASPGTSPEIRRNAAIALVVSCLLWTWLITGVRNQRFFRWRARRIFRSSPNGAGYVEWSIDPDQLSNRTSHSASTILWPLFTKVVEAPKGFMLYQNVQLFNWIPGHAFDSEGEMRRFAERARDRVSNYIVIGECQYVGKPEPIDPDAF